MQLWIQNTARKHCVTSQHASDLNIWSGYDPLPSPSPPAVRGAVFRGDEPSKCEGWFSGLGLSQPWQDPLVQIESRHVWSSFSELLLFNCDLQECVRYGNLSRNARYRLSKSTLWNGPLPSRLREGLVCKLMLSLHLERAIYSASSPFQQVIVKQWTVTSFFRLMETAWQENRKCF